MIANGHYEPNRPGAASLRDPLYIGTDQVTAGVDGKQGSQTVAVFVGCKLVYEGRIPSGAKKSTDEFVAWVCKTATEAILVETTVNGSLIHVTAYVPYRASVRSANSKAAWAARKQAGGKVSRISSGGQCHGDGSITYTYTYVRAVKTNADFEIGQTVRVTSRKGWLAVVQEKFTGADGREYVSLDSADRKGGSGAINYPSQLEAV